MLYLTLRQFEYVVAVADYGGLTQAAVALNVSQPSLSVALTQVEGHLGCKLFIRRRGTPLRTTAQGDDFVAEARELLKNAARMENPHLSLSDKIHPVRLGIFEDIAPRFLGPILVASKRTLTNFEILPTVGDFPHWPTGEIGTTGSVDYLRFRFGCYLCPHRSYARAAERLFTGT